MLTAFSRPWPWCLAGVGLLLNLAIVYLAISLFADRSSGATVPRHLHVPYEQDETVWEPYRRWVVQEDGRLKPFDTFCRESVRAVTGRERFEQVRSTTTGHVLVPGHDPVAVVVSWMMPAAPANPDWEHYPFLWCRHTELRQRLYEEARAGGVLSEEDRFGHHVEPALLRQSAALAQVVRQALRKREQDSRAPLLPVEREALDVLTRLQLYDRIRQADGFQVVALERADAAWFSLQSLRSLDGSDGADLWERALHRRRLDNPELYEGQEPQPLPAEEIRGILAAFTALQDSYSRGEAPGFAAASAEFFLAIEQVSRQFHEYPGTDTIERELWYNRVNPFRKAWLFSLLATLALAGGLLFGLRWRKAGGGLYVAGLLASVGCLAWAIAGFVCRVTIAGRPPVSNMYESLIWVAFMVLVCGLLLEAVYRRGIIALAATLVATLGFVLADQLPLTFSPALQPLQAVLRSNYWLVVHVLPMVSSYAPFALAWGLGNLNLGLILFAPDRRDLIQALSLFCYRAIQIGVLLLFLGTMLGGFWAAESWGRFWGWDPKEVWALIALLCYLIPLHARYLGWVRDFGLAVGAVVCFAAVVMAWYGVNFVLGAGLHSYGFGNGDDRWIYLAGLVNISLVVHGAWRYGAAGGATSS